MSAGTAIAGFVARSALMTSPVGAILKVIPRWAWIALAIALTVVAAVVWHGRQVAAHDKALTAQVIAQRDAQWTKRLADERKAALTWKTKADQQLRAMTELRRKLTDEENRRLAADAAAVRLRGPGAAAAPVGCRPGDHSGLSGIADRRVAQPGPAANAGTEVLAADGTDRWAIVPWNWLVDVVSERDAFRVEAIGWRGWHAEIAGVWQRMQAAGAPQDAKGKDNGR